MVAYADLDQRTLSPYVGGQLELQGDGSGPARCGEIASIELTGSGLDLTLTVSFTWFAAMANGGQWDAVEPSYTAKMVFYGAYRMDEGVLCLRPDLGSGEKIYLFPPGEQRLDRSRVHGLAS